MTINNTTSTNSSTSGTLPKGPVIIWRRNPTESFEDVLAIQRKAEAVYNAQQQLRKDIEDSSKTVEQIWNTMFEVQNAGPDTKERFIKGLIPLMDMVNKLQGKMNKLQDIITELEPYFGKDSPVVKTLEKEMKAAQQEMVQLRENLAKVIKALIGLMDIVPEILFDMMSQVARDKPTREEGKGTDIGAIMQGE